MKIAKPGAVLLCVCILSACGQEISESLAPATDITQTNPTASSPASIAPKQNKSDQASLQQALEATRQQLKDAEAKLSRARQELADQNQQLMVLNREQAMLDSDRKEMTATTRHVDQLEQQLVRQDSALNQLRETLLETEAGCKEVADQLARNAQLSALNPDKAER